MSEIRCVVHLPFQTFLPTDQALNVWHFFGEDDAATLAAWVMPKLVLFYNAVQASTFSVANFISGDVSRPSCRIISYDLADPEPRAIVDELPFTLGAIVGSSGANLPHEVAVCTSFAADYASGTPNARRRGRIFLGPLCGVATVSTVSQNTVVSPSLITTLTQATKQLALAVVPAGRLGIYSRADGVVREARKGWVDNAFDTQRRRGQVASTRTNWSV